MDRRQFFKLGFQSSAAVMGAPWLVKIGMAQESELVTKVEQSVAAAHAVIWRKFISKDGLMLDFADKDGQVSLPTAEECRLGKPNALGWGTPIENGPMFTGMYLESLLLRWSLKKEDEVASKVKKLVAGLLSTASASDIPGFIVRGFAEDGKSYYPMGSDDQIAPWFYGLWCYCRSELATKEVVQEITAVYLKTADALLNNDWRIPAAQPFGSRGSFKSFEFDHVTRLLFVCRTAYELSHDTVWRDRYFNYLREVSTVGVKLMDRLDVCQKGMVYHYAPTHSWTSCTSVACLRVLWEMEEIESIKRVYLQGLKASMTLAAKNLGLAKTYKVGEVQPFEFNWRVLNNSWKPQSTEQEAAQLGGAQLREMSKLSPQRGRETALVREPCSAAWIVTLYPELAEVRKFEADIFTVIMQYHYPELVYSQFFWVENAFWRLKALEAEAVSKAA